MKTKKRGQVSIEYLVVLGFATFAITGIIALAFYYVNSTNDQMKSNHIQTFAKSVIDNAESIYFAGPPSKITINPYLPSGVNKIDIYEKEIVINYSTSSGENIIGFKSNAPLKIKLDAITPSDGIKNIVIEFHETDTDKIKISEAN